MVLAHGFGAKGTLHEPERGLAVRSNERWGVAANRKAALPESRCIAITSHVRSGWASRIVVILGLAHFRPHHPCPPETGSRADHRVSCKVSEVRLKKQMGTDGFTRKPNPLTRAELQTTPTDL
jgi:hypothetical protein